MHPHRIKQRAGRASGCTIISKARRSSIVNAGYYRRFRRCGKALKAPPDRYWLQ